MFTAQFRPTGATPHVFVLHFPDCLSAFDTRVFQVGVECLIVDGCRGVVCDVEQPLRHISCSTTTTPGDEQAGLLIMRITQLLGHGVRRIVLVHGEALRNTMQRFVPLENYEREADAIAALADRLT